MLFNDMMHKEIEVYVDDMIAKSQGKDDHVVNLRKPFERLRKFQLKLNPIKCTFGAISGKLLGLWSVRKESKLIQTRCRQYKTCLGIHVLLIKGKIIIFELSTEILKFIFEFRNLRDYFVNFKFLIRVHIF